ncbi:MAG: Spy/CpxP family protein refolding chaperone [candidate division WOR-3 bacterium]|nr:MAG: Spy/CpxP family protein refolding chaperone [candidate division WOR-3 bacterium]
MKKTGALIVAVVVIAGLSLTSLAYAQPERAGGQRCAGHKGKGSGMMGLDLTGEQHKKIDDLKMKHIKEVMPLKTDLRIKQMELGALWRADELDEKKIIAKVKEISGLREKLQVAKVEQRLNMYKVLTPEQRNQARKFMMGRRGMGRMFGHGRRGMGGMRGPGCCPVMGQGMHGMGQGMHGMGRGMGHSLPHKEAPPEPPPTPEGD